jgi:hypothetical protein
MAIAYSSCFILDTNPFLLSLGESKTDWVSIYKLPLCENPELLYSQSSYQLSFEANEV